MIFAIITFVVIALAVFVYLKARPARRTMSSRPDRPILEDR